MKTEYSVGDLVYLRESIPDEWYTNDSDWQTPEFFKNLGRGPFVVTRGLENSKYLQIKVDTPAFRETLVRPEEVLPYSKPILEGEAEWE